MLQILRNQASSWIVKILLGLLILSFGIWGINDIFLGERDPTVAKVGGVKITRSEVNDEIRQEINRLQPMFGGRLDRAEADRMGITNQVVENMVNRAAMSLGARDLGVTVSDQQVARRIRSDKTFFNARNQFDRNIFTQVLSRAGMTENFYVSSLKRDLAAAEINGAISAATQVPSGMIDPLVRFRAERRVAKTVVVPAPPAKAIPDPSPADVEAYYKANKQRFMAPPLRNVTYIHLDPKVMAKEIQVSDHRIKKGYKDRLDQFTTPSRRKLEQVVFEKKENAETAEKAIKAGKSLAEAAKAAGKKTKPVELGWIGEKDILPELSKPVFALEKGQTSQPIKTALGWHIVHVLDVQKRSVKPLSEVRDKVKNEIAEHDAEDAIYGMINKVEDALAGGSSLEDVAKQLNLHAVHLPAIDSRGRNADGKQIEGLPSTSKFLQIAFQTPDGQESQLTETGRGGFFVLHVNSATPAKARPLDKIKNDVVAAWKAEKRADAAEKRANAIAEQVRKGEKLAAVAKKEKLDVNTSPEFTRLSHDSESGVPASLMDKLFTLKPGQVATGEGSGGYVVAELTSVREPSKKESEETADNLQQELHQGIAGDLFQQLIGAMRKRYDIEIHRNVLHEGP